MNPKHWRRDILPAVNPKNVHNVILLPLIWITKNHGFAIEARVAFEQYVVRNSNEKISRQRVVDHRKK
jgi:hypothetical protein